MRNIVRSVAVATTLLFHSGCALLEAGSTSPEALNVLPVRIAGSGDLAYTVWPCYQIVSTEYGPCRDKAAEICRSKDERYLLLDSTFMAWPSSEVAAQNTGARHWVWTIQCRNDASLRQDAQRAIESIQRGCTLNRC